VCMPDTMPDPSRAVPKVIGHREEEADALLVRQFAQGDAAAFDRLVGRHQGSVARLVHRLLGWSEDPADVVQEVFVAVLTKLGEFRGECRFSTWLTANTVNKCRHIRRQRFLRLAFLRRAKSAVVAAAAGPGVSEELGPEALDRVRRAIRALPARHREVVVLRYLEEMPVAEVGRALGISAHAAEMRLHRARDRLREALSDLVEE